MDSCYTGDHIAGDHIYTDITTCPTSPHSTTDEFLSVFSFRLCFDKNL